MLFSKNVQTKIARVFTAPSHPLPDHRTPFLYLLRRDLELLYGHENRNGSVKAPLLACLGIMVGFELLAKMWSGNYQAESKELISFLENVTGLPSDKADALAQFRHALAHGYRLSTRKKKGQEIYEFHIDDSDGATECVSEVTQKVFKVNVPLLKRTFINSINEYRKLLEASFDLQKKFEVCTENIGEVQIT
ncbi:MAG: hypothetical protein WA104_01985 [Thermodesulfovibrionales bacterium]